MIGGYKLLLWIGILVIVLPFIGVPVFWKEIVLFFIGIILVSQSLFIQHKKKMFLDAKDEEVFVENKMKN